MPALTLAEIADKIGGEVVGDGNLIITGTAEIDKAADGEITFLANSKYRPYLDNSQASAVIIDGQTSDPPAIPHIVTKDAYFAFLQTFMLYYEPVRILPIGIHPSAVIEESAVIGKDAAIGANVYIGPNVRIGDRCQIFPNCVILNDCEIGDDCLFYPLVSIRERCRIGDRAIIHNGAVIGSDGFGFAPYQGKFHKIPQVGVVVIGDDVEIGANVTIDRATMGETVVKSGVKLDNLVHLAHNVVVGENSVFAGQAGVAGSGRIGKNVMVGGQVAIVGHLTVGDGVRIAGKSGITKSIPDGETVYGVPARPIGRAKRIEAAMANLPEMQKRIRALEKKLEKLGEE